MSFKLQWQPSNKAEEQEVYRDTQPVPNEPAYAPLAALSSSDTEYTDTTPEAFTRYYYRVAAVRRQFGLERSLSNQVAIGYESGPSLELVFTDQEYAILDGAGVLQPSTFGALLNFSRASVATYIDANGMLQTAPINEPRFTYDPVTLEPEGLLVEEARTNLLLQSDNLGLSPWLILASYFRMQVSSDHPYLPPQATVTQYGPNNGVMSFTNEVVRQNLPSTLPAGTNYVLRADFKAVGATTSVRFLPDNTGGGALGAVFYLNGTGSITTISPANENFETTSTEMTSLGNGWYRCVIGFKTVRDISAFRFRAFPYVGTNQLTGDGTSGLLATMAQLEAGSFPTSYIPTQASQVTRAADTPVVNTLSPWFNQSEGTLFVDGVAAIPNSGELSPLVKISTSLTASDGIGVHRKADGVYQVSTRGATHNTINLENVPIAYMAISYDASNARVSMNGAAVKTAPNAWVTAPNAMYIGCGPIGGTNALTKRTNGHIKRIAYYPRALTDAELIALTSP